MKNKKFKKFIKPLLLCITLLITFGLCFTLNTKVKAAGDELEENIYIKVNTGTFAARSTDPITAFNVDFTMQLHFTVIDENSEAEIEYFSITGRTVEEGANNTKVKYIYFNRGTTFNPDTSKLITTSVYGQWISNPTITILENKYYDNTELNHMEYPGAYWLMLNYPGSAERVGYISGRYDFNQGQLESVQIPATPGGSPTNPYNYPLNISGYLVEPFALTDEQLNEYDYLDVPAGTYYLSTFRNVYLSVESDGSVSKLEFEMYIPGVNDYVKINFIRNGEIYEPHRKTIIFDSSFVNITTYNFLTKNGIFNRVNPPSDYSPTDLLFGIVDVPVRYLQSMLSFDLLGITFWTIFASFITLGLAIWIVKKL